MSTPKWCAAYDWWVLLQTSLGLETPQLESDNSSYSSESSYEDLDLILVAETQQTSVVCPLVEIHKEIVHAAIDPQQQVVLAVPTIVPY